jgi:hypothetical protein
MATIPNVKRFRPFCPTCNEAFTLMAVLPKDANVDAYPGRCRLPGMTTKRSRVQSPALKVRVGQQKQKKAK